MCRNRFNATTETKFALNVLDNIHFKCKKCDLVYPYKERLQHCHDIGMNCPFGCDPEVDRFPKHPEKMQHHLNTRCNSKQLQCRDCGYDIYKVYSKADL